MEAQRRLVHATPTRGARVATPGSALAGPDTLERKEEAELPHQTVMWWLAVRRHGLLSNAALLNLVLPKAVILACAGPTSAQAYQNRVWARAGGLPWACGARTCVEVGESGGCGGVLRALGAGSQSGWTSRPASRTCCPPSPLPAAGAVG
jgi:hypothetical protein